MKTRALAIVVAITLFLSLVAVVASLVASPVKAEVGASGGPTSEYFWGVWAYTYDSDGDGFVDSVQLEMDVDTTGGYVNVTVYGGLYDPYGYLTDSGSSSWLIYDEYSEYGYLYLTNYSSYTGYCSYYLDLYDNLGYLEDSWSGSIYLYPLQQDEYFWGVWAYTYDSDGDGFVDSVQLEMDVDTTGGYVNVTVYGGLYDPYGYLTDSGSSSWLIYDEYSEYGYLYLTNYSSYTGYCSYYLDLYDNLGYLEDSWSGSVYLYPVDTTPPAVPALISPSNGVKTNDATPTLDWGDVTDPSGVTYDLQVASDANFSSPIINQTGLDVSNYTASPLAGGTYYWRVKAVDGANNESSWSTAWSFAIDTTPPAVPALISPSNGVKTNDATPTLDWGDVTDPSGVTYNLQVASDANFSSPIINQTGLDVSNYTTFSLSEGTSYWRVKAVDGANNESSWSTVWSFSVDTTPPAVPALISPSNGVKTNDATPTLDWGDVTDPSGVTYDLQVASDANFSSPIINQTGLDVSNYTASPLAGGTYYWRVKAVDGANNESSWSTAWSFAIDTTPPAVPALISPSNGVKTNDATPTLDWGDVTDPSGVTYNLQVASDANFSSPIINQTGLGVSNYTTFSLSEGTSYWRVKGVDGAANESSWSSAWSFALDTTPPIISDLAASDVTTSTAIISWTTDEPCSSQVRYGTTTAYGLTSSLDITLTNSHSVTLADLKGGTTYHIRVISVDSAGNEAVSADYAFATASHLPIAVIAGASAGGIIVLGIAGYFLLMGRKKTTGT
jgi:hypothetical protein